MSNYFRDELMHLVDEWDIVKLDTYIQLLEERLVHTRAQIQDMKNLRRKKLRNSKLKETGPRDGR